MAYSVLSDLQGLVSDEELVQLTDDAGLAIDGAKVALAVARADERIDGYLANLAAVPVSPVPPLVVQYSAKLALTELYLRRSSAQLPESWARERMEILRHLDDLAKGRAKLSGLVLPSGAAPVAGSKALEKPTESYPLGLLERF